MGKPQTWQILNEDSLVSLETSDREPLDNFNVILNSKYNYPFRLSLTGSVITVNESEIQTLKSNGSGTTENSFKIATAPIQNQYVSFADSTLNFSSGAVTGDFDASPFSPTMVAGNYVWMGAEAKSGGNISIVWGSQNSASGLATYPTFTSGTGIFQVLLHSTGGGTWNFDTPLSEDFIIFKGSGGGGGGSSDFVPIYKSSTQYRIQSSQGRQVRFNEKYFWSNDDLDFNYNLGSDTLYYICIDTDQAQGEINSGNQSTYIVETELDPQDPSFPENLVVLGYYEVVSGAVTQQNVGTFSVREIDTLVGDLSVSFNSPTQYRVQSARDRKIRLNNKYFDLTSDITQNFDTSADGNWYICIDTTKTEGTLSSTHLVETMLDPKDKSFPKNLVVIGEYVVSGSSVTQANVNNYSMREMNSSVGDLIPSYESTTEYRVQNTDGRKIRLLDEYFYLEDDIVKTFDTSASGTWYIAIDTDNTAGEIQSSYLLETQEDPTSPSFDPDYVAIGEYFVDSSLNVPISGFTPYNVAGAASFGGAEHFVPVYVNSAQFSIRSTADRKVHINNRYFYSSSEVLQNFDTSSDGLWYICFDSSGASGSVNSSYFVMTQIDPQSRIFNPYYTPIGEYQVISGTVSKPSFIGYSTREIISWVYGIPNVQRRAEIQSASGSYTFTHDFYVIPDVVTYKYWDDSSGKAYNFDRSDIETGIDENNLYYTIPGTNPLITFDTGDYFEVEAFYYAHTTEGGFASPKTDYSSQWYTTTPPLSIPHYLYSKPLDISLEIDDNGTFYSLEDALSYVDKNTGKGITTSQVWFNWAGLPVTLSSSVKMRIHFHLSKLSAGAFEANKTESGTVTTIGDQTAVFSPDLILDSTSTNLATIINGAGNDIKIYLKEDVTVSSIQDISSVTGVIWDCAPGAKIICDTALASSVIKFGNDITIRDLRLELTHTSGTTNSGFEFDGDRGYFDNTQVIMNGTGGTLTDAFIINSGKKANYIKGMARQQNGTITNSSTDNSGNATNDMTVRPMIG